MSAAQHVLTYFPIPARAFVTRVCLGAARIPYKVVPVMGRAALAALRGPSGSSAAVPLGQLPVLTLPSGEVITQSGAHMRYAGKKAGLYPREDDEAALRIDELLGVVEDAISKVPRGGEAEALKAARALYAKEALPLYLRYLSKKLGGGPFFAGSKLSIGDLAVFSLTDALDADAWDHVDGAAVLAAFPALHAHHAALAAHPLVVQHGHLPARKAPRAS